MLYQATGEGLGPCPKAERGWNSLQLHQHTLFCHQGSGPGSVLTVLTCLSLGSGLASTEDHLPLACHIPVLKPILCSRNLSPCLSLVLWSLF